MENEQQTNIRVINDTIVNILNKGVEITKAYGMANKELRELNFDKNRLQERKTKLLNTLFKYSKKKELFKFINDDADSKIYNQNFTIGLNCSGLGIKGEYDNNLKNISEYYSKSNFEKLCENPRFVKELLSYAKEENKDAIKKCLTSYRGDYEGSEELKENLWANIKREITFNKTEGKSYYNSDMEVLDIKVIDNTGNEKIGYLKNITDKFYNINYKEIVNYQFLIDNKIVILEYLNKKIKYFKAEDKILKSKVGEIDIYLKPYEALEKI